MKKLIFLLLLTLQILVTKANNIQVTNVSVQQATNTIQFTVSWENGWRSSVLNNWDAAWVFVKYKDVDNEYKNLLLNTTGNTVPAGFAGDFFQSGAMLYRSAVGNGSTSISNVQIGIPAQPAQGIYDIKVFALEMVYIPSGTFYVGDGVSGAGRYIQEPSLPSSIGTVFTAGIGNQVYDPLISPSGDYLTSMPAGFPRGMTNFYMMKYELSQGAYRDFLNTLTYNQQVNHTIIAPSAATGSGALVAVSGTNRNSLEIKTSGTAITLPAEYGCDANNNNIYDEPADGEWVACNYLNWPDMAAYLGWSGLRPMTELEFEKAARGVQVPVAGEYAWGSTFIVSTILSLANGNQNSEVATNAAATIGNAVYNSSYPNVPFSGPLRNGIFATASSNRITSGGGFYGVMELSGNLAERVISTANGQGFRSNLNLYGLAPNGFFGTTATDGWPGATATNSYVINGTQNAIGLMDRGGHWSNTNTILRTSYRDAASLITNTAVTRDAVHGCRGVRSAQ